MDKLIIDNAKQQSKEWKEIRKYKITGSNIYSFYFVQLYSDDKLLELLNVKDKVFNDEQLIKINHGIKYEPIARDLYIKETGNKVIELGFCYLKENQYLGCSVDGYVPDGNGIIEIKCPYDKKYDKIPIQYYYQMQYNMFIMSADWCDFVVYYNSEITIERVYFNEIFFCNSLTILIHKVIEYIKKI